MKLRSPHPISVLGVLALTPLFVALAVFGWWIVQPVTLPSIGQPIPVENENNEIAVGEPIVLRLVIDKPQDVRVTDVTRLLICDSGNLVTLTANESNIPVGMFDVTVNDVLLPDKVTEGDRCRFVYRTEYRINPIRTETAEWRSEPFVVVTR